ncbi:segregation/condensation protein A [Streptococcaceae bacterium ESL0687]|nr:segregation/condensation protein A [Streptococcaceae bacterium ESL0687]
MNNIKIKIKDFEGPLDLLLHLVNQYKMDIYEVPLVSVIEQYLTYVNSMKILELELASEYLVMASQLILIKSRRLLPTVAEEMEDNGLDLEQELLSQIDEYRKFKLLSEELRDLHEERSAFYSKEKTEIPSDEGVLVHDKTSIDIFLAFSKIIEQKKAEFKDENNIVLKESFSIEEKIKEVGQIIRDRGRIVFSDLFNQSTSKDEMITIFLATLELIKNQLVICSQEEAFGSIILEGVGEYNEQIG